MKKIIFVLILVLSAGCIFVSRNFNTEEAGALTLGMSKDEVTGIMGRPSDIKTVVFENKAHEVLRYPFIRKNASKVNAIDKTYYDMYFLDGALVHWEKVRLYAQPDYEMRPEDPDSPVRTFKLLQGKEE